MEDNFDNVLQKVYILQYFMPDEQNEGFALQEQRLFISKDSLLQFLSENDKVMQFSVNTTFVPVNRVDEMLKQFNQ